MTVVLIEWNWGGHHSAYFKYFTKALLELGHEVLAICPEPEEVESWIDAQDLGGELKEHLQLLRYASPKIRVRPRRWQGAVDSFLSFRWIKKSLEAWERDHGRAIDLVFFACIYDWDFRHFPQSSRGFAWPWSGLYLHCRSFRMPGSLIPYQIFPPCPEKIFRHPNLQSASILDEGAVDYMQAMTRGHPVFVFPDIADDSPPAVKGLAERMKEFAAGRPLVGALGHLQPTKGVATLARVALDPAKKDIAFAFAGELMLGVYSPEDRKLIERLGSAPNVFTHFKKVPDGPLFNSLIQACDVLFAGYDDFPNSSNILTKAALFETPVIVSDGYLMAERVRQFGMGEVVPERDALATVAAIRAITANYPQWLAARRPQWEAYRSAHSISALRDAFKQVLAAVGCQQGEAVSSAR